MSEGTLVPPELQDACTAAMKQDVVYDKTITIDRTKQAKTIEECLAMRNVEPQKRARIPVTPELLGQMLCLPEGVKIDGCWFDLDSRCIVLAVAGDALPASCDVSDGKIPPSLKPIYRTVDYKMLNWGDR